MTMIDIKNLTFGYDGCENNIFENVDIRIDTSWKLGLIGRNGRGKTTFLKILRQELQYKGKISGIPEFVSFPFEIENEYDMGIDVIKAIAPMAEDWIIRREMNYMKLEEDVLYRPYMLLSGGEKTKLQLITLFLDEGRFPLIDEPTNHLDMRGRELIAGYLKNKDGFILVSHDRHFLDSCTDHTMAINKSNIEISNVSFSTWWEEMKRKEQFEMSQDDKLRKEINQLNKSKEAAEKWSAISEKRKIGFDPKVTEKNIGRRSYEGAKSKKMMSHAKNMERRYDNKIEEKSKLLNNFERKQTLLITGEKHFSDMLVTTRNLVMNYDGDVVNRPFNLEINQGDRVALTGVNGCGKSTFLKLLRGDDIAFTGDIVKASRLKISYVRQDASDLKGTLKEIAYEAKIDEPRFKSILSKMGFTEENLYMETSLLSQGQKKCVLLAVSLCQEVNLFIWDEPLNFVDIYVRQALEEMLLDSSITMLFVEHDKFFVDTIATSIVEMEIDGDKMI
ncbi:MAG: ATP-binding cassette domain-containing protein [Clostridia bacterium]|nr:ATP-binding cassette domain-containing protein [Clostridia bacterium]